MIIEQNRDGTYSASQMSAFGRIQVADMPTRNQAVAELLAMLKEQLAEAYYHEQVMTHQSLSNDPEGMYK
tara:strand:- start:2380 stop:2589 length:210 start_codon:yes stop_codon:yes gene_type:complete